MSLPFLSLPLSNNQDSLKFTYVVENEEVPAAVIKEFVLLGSSHFEPDLLQENGS